MQRPFAFKVLNAKLPENCKPLYLLKYVLNFCMKTTEEFVILSSSVLIFQVYFGSNCSAIKFKTVTSGMQIGEVIKIIT